VKNQILLPPRNNFYSSNLVYWEDFLTENEIEIINKLPEWGNLNAATVGPNNESTVNNNIRVSKTNFIYPNLETFEIWLKITETISFVNRKFFNFDLTGCYEGAQLGLYDENERGHYDWHIDQDNVSQDVVPRKLSMALLLNDVTEFEGGFFQVKNENDQIKTLEMKKGRAWFFPSYTLHRVTPVTKGIRKSLVIWVGGPPFK